MEEQEKAGHSGRLWLIFIHGAGGNALHWANQTDYFASSEAVTLPGHRLTEFGEDDTRRSVDDYANWLHQYLVAETNVDHKSGKIVLVGHGMGGSVAMSYGLIYPGEISGLVLVDAAARLTFAPEFLSRLDTDYQGAIQAILNNAFAPTADPLIKRSVWEQIEQLPPNVIRRDFHEWNDDHTSSRELLRLGQQPVAVIAGEHDGLAPVAYANFLAEHIPNAHLDIVTGAGHYSMLEKPTEFNLLLENFLTRIK